MRCFLAIELPETVRQRLGRLQEDLASLGREVRWTRPEQIHLTLCFLGEVPDADIPAICDALATAATRSEPVELEVRGAGCFPDHGPARVVWAGVVGPPPALVRCHDRCEDAFAELGFAPEQRPFHPHLTIGRTRERRGSPVIRPALAPHADFKAASFLADEIVLFQSVLQSRGPIHTPLTRAALSAGPANIQQPTKDPEP